MTADRLLQTAAATLAALTLAACGGADVESETYAEVEPNAPYAVTEAPNQAVMGAVERNDLDTDDMDDADALALDDVDLDDELDDDVDTDLDMDDNAVTRYRAVDDYELYRK